MRYINFDYIGKKLLNWGISFPENEESLEKPIDDLCKRLTDNLSCESYILLAILDEMMDLKRQIGRHVHNENSRRRWIAKRVPKHGNMPPIVAHWLEERVCFRNTHGGYFFSDSIPAKGTKIRKEYDRWMRKKIKI